MTLAEPPAGPVTCTYDADNRRVAKGTPDGSVTRYLYDSRDLLRETDAVSGDDLTYSSTVDQEFGDLVGEYGSDGSETYHQYDAQWSTNALLDERGNTMKWFSAHVVMYLKILEGEQRSIPIMENIHLLYSDSHESARAAAEIIGRETAVIDPTLTYNGKRAAWTFAGVRKTILCQDEDMQPFHGEEVTYSEMEVASEQDLERFMNGERVCVIFEMDGKGKPDPVQVLRSPDTLGPPIRGGAE